MSPSNRGRDQIRQRLKEDLVKPMTTNEKEQMAHLDSPAQPAEQATAGKNEVIRAARQAVDRLRDFARMYGMDFRDRDPLVAAIHRAIDLAEGR